MKTQDVHNHQPVESDTNPFTRSESAARNETDMSIEPDPKPGPGEADLATVMPEVNGLPPNKRRRIRQNVFLTVQGILAAAEKIDPWLDQIDQLVGFRSAWARMLRVYARACLHAYLVALRPTTPATLISEATKLRKKLMALAELLVVFGMADSERVAAIRTGWGHSKLANDLVELASLLRELWPQVKSQPFVTVAMVERAATLGYELHERLGGTPEPGETELDAKEIRDAAWTLMLQAYEECQRAIGYLAPDQVEEIAPSIYVRSRRTEEGDEAEESEQADEAVGGNGVSGAE